MNQDEIAKTICVQRKIVNNTCNGRCELNKSIKKYNDSEKKANSNLVEKTDFVFISHSVYANDKQLDFKSQYKKSLFFSLEKKPIAVASATFRPPSFFI